MLVVVVFESLMGNTRRVAETIAEGIRATRPEIEVRCGTVSEADADAAAADLLVVGAPTHFFVLPSPRSRRLWTRGCGGSSVRGSAFRGRSRSRSGRYRRRRARG